MAKRVATVTAEQTTFVVTQRTSIWCTTYASVVHPNGKTEGITTVSPGTELLGIALQTPGPLQYQCLTCLKPIQYRLKTLPMFSCYGAFVAPHELPLTLQFPTPLLEPRNRWNSDSDSATTHNQCSSRVHVMNLMDSLQIGWNGTNMHYESSMQNLHLTHYSHPWHNPKATTSPSSPTIQHKNLAVPEAHSRIRSSGEIKKHGISMAFHLQANIENRLAHQIIHLQSYAQHINPPRNLPKPSEILGTNCFTSWTK